MEKSKGLMTDPPVTVPARDIQAVSLAASGTSVITPILLPISEVAVVAPILRVVAVTFLPPGE